MHKTLISLALLALLGAPAAARPRSIAVLEYRAGVTSAANLAESVAGAIERLTSNRVIAPADARRVLGAAVDESVARCKGQAACIARIGKRLGCSEVVLVGISQLGDLIIAIQRISVRRGRTISRLADSLRTTSSVPDDAVARYVKRLLPPGDFKRFGRIVVRTGGEGDEVFIDERPRGRTPVPPLRVPAPGRYSLQVTRPGHTDFVASLDVLPNATVEVKATLTPLNASLQWYERWWVWAIVGGVVAGTATAIAAVSLSRQPDSVPAVIQFGNR